MHDVDRTRESCARHRPGLLPLLAASACWLLAAAAGAQTPPPSAAPAPLAAPVTPWRAALERQEAPEEPPAPAGERGADPAGALGWEIVGGVVPTVAGFTLIVASLADPHSGGHVPTFRVNLPVLALGAVLTLAGPPIGVIIAGDASGGTGSAGFTFLGAFGGLILGAPGIVIGSIIGYRLSADDVAKRTPSRTQAARLVPILGRHEVGLQWSGTLAL